MSSSASSWRKSRANSILRNAGGRAKSVPFGFPCPFFQTSANPLRQGMIASADAQTNVAIKVKKQIPPKVAVPKGSRGRPESPPCRARRRDSPCNKQSQVTWECTAKVSKGRPQSPRLAPAGAKSLLAEKSHYGRKTNYVVAPIWRDNMRQVG